MRTKSVLVSGPADKGIKYKLGQADPAIKRGVWEVAVHSLTFYFTAKVSSVVTVSTNYSQDHIVNESGERCLEPTILTMNLCSGKPGSKLLTRSYIPIFFEVNSVSDTLEVFIKDVATKEPVKDVTAYVLLMFRKKN